MMRFLVTGASGQLGRFLLRQLVAVGAEVAAWSGTTSGVVDGVPLCPVDLTNRDRVAKAFREASPAVVMHAAARASVADCFRDPESARLVNYAATATLAELAAESAARFVFVSTDLVFDGERAPYREADPPAPCSVYGRTKADAERAVLATNRGVVVRVSLLYGPSLGRPSFFDHQVSALGAGRPITAFHDEWRTPLDLLTAARALIAIAQCDFRDTMHVGGPERLSRFEMGQRLARHLHAAPSLIVAASRASAGFAEPRPRDVSLDSSLWREWFPSQPWPDFDAALTAMGVGA